MRQSHLDGDEFLRYVERGVKVSGKPYMYQGEAMFLKLYEHIAERFPNTTIVSGQTADAALDSGLPWLRTNSAAASTTTIPIDRPNTQPHHGRVAKPCC